MDNVKELLKRTLRTNKLCCCAGDFQCANCRKIDSLTSPRDYACQNCLAEVNQ